MTSEGRGWSESEMAEGPTPRKRGARPKIKLPHPLYLSHKKNDTVFRWGGEEICILLNTDEERAVAAAERIRADIAKIRS